MAITGTKLFSTGDVLTAADTNQYLMRGVKVFASSTARDDAYGGAGEPTLEEGEACYLADTNVLQTYDGAAWNSLSSTVSAISTAEVLTSQTFTSPTYGDLATAGPAVTITTGTKVLVIISAQCSNATSQNIAIVSFAVSGATTTAASDANALYVTSPTSNSIFAVSAVIPLTVTAGSNTFTAKYRVGGGTTGTFVNRRLTVVAYS
jgi:hypothetical protein